MAMWRSPASPALARWIASSRKAEMVVLTPLVVALTLRTPTQPLHHTPSVSRRGFAASLGVALTPVSAIADFVMSDEEKARVQRKMELLRAKSGGAPAPKPSVDAQTGMQMNQQFFENNMRSDYNPEAAAALRSRSFVENAKATLASQEELKKRDKKQKREDMCEMLGRGC